MIFEKRISWRCHLHSKEEKNSFSWNSTEKPLTKTFHFGYMFDTADGSSCRWLWLTRTATPYWNCIPWSTQHSASPLHPCLVLETHQEPRFAAGLLQSCSDTGGSAAPWPRTDRPKSSRASSVQVQACACVLTYFLAPAWKGPQAACSTPLQLQYQKLL